MNLTEFLLDRIAEDEEAAKRAAFGYGASWTSEDDAGEDWSVVHSDGKRDMVGCEDRDVTGHIARHDPARVLAECDAKRRIVECGRSECSDYGPPGSEVRTQGEEIAKDLGIDYRPHWPEAYSPFCDGCGSAQSADHEHEWVLRLLALPHAGHPDYREEWRP